MNKEEFKKYLTTTEALQRTLRFGGEVNEDNIQKLLEQFLGLFEKDQEKPIIVHMNSNGGSASKAYSFYDTIKLYLPNLFTIGSGIVASACIPMLLSAEKDKRFGTPNSRYIIHSATRTYEKKKFNAVELKEEYEELLSVNKIGSEIISKETKLTIDQIEREMATECSTSAIQALEFDFISGIL